MTVNQLPQDLQASASWLVANADKIPVKPASDHRICGDKKPHLMTFQDVRQLIQNDLHQFPIYYHHDQEPFTSLDIDSARDPDTGELQPWCLALLQQLTQHQTLGYLEYSSSGRGFRLPCSGKFQHSKAVYYATDQRGKGCPKFELLGNGHLATYTGNIARESGPAQAITPLPMVLGWLHQRYPGQQPAAPKPDHSPWIPANRSHDNDRQKVLDALAYLSPDCGHDQWKQIGMALHDWDPGPEGFELWLQWSRPGKSFQKESDLKTAWKSFRQGKGLTLATLFHLAQGQGFPVASHFALRDTPMPSQPPDDPPAADNVVPIDIARRPPPPPERLIGNTVLSDPDLERLQAINRNCTHSHLGGKHCIIRQRYNTAYEGLTHSFESIKDFHYYFLHEPKLANMNAGHAWLKWSEKNYRPGGVVFQPNTRRCPSDVYNLWQGFAVEPQAGDCQPYLQHLQRIICRNNRTLYHYLIQWLAHLVQQPAVKPSVAILMQSIEGTGKGAMVQPLKAIFGQHYMYLNGSDMLTGRFNGSLSNRLLVFADETNLADPKVAEKIRALVSETVVGMELKYFNAELMANFSRFIFANNGDGQVLHAGLRERRYLMLEPEPGVAQDARYFQALYRWIEQKGAQHLLHYLLNDVDLKPFSRHQAPVTLSLVRDKLESMSPVKQWCYEWLAQTEPFPQRISRQDLAQNFLEWFRLNTRQLLTLRSAGTQVGLLMKTMNIRSYRKDPKESWWYELPCVDDIKTRFSALLGHQSKDVFDD
ncbi:MAG: PriCT-2 domain-containing protein [Endozoicomonas sp.]